ncbi:hypothetical protein ACFSQP_09365 [Bizionia sediminis]|uniref:Outer membrane protein beta-barrel domain-containing protein n=1 Tax=Bizionia sediminis TaxID=1737064 RepID=A0ABW5KSY9_9FLAO
MNTFKSILVVLLLFVFFTGQGQETEKASKFNIIGYGGIGFAMVENNNEPNYNLNSNSGDILLNYKLNEKIGFATGIGINELSGNGFNTLGNFYHERSYLKIPALVTMSSEVLNNFNVVVSIGLYGQTIIKDSYRYLNETEKNLYSGWNLGAQFGVGFLFNMLPNFQVGMHYNGLSDFSKISTESNQAITDKQKLKNVNTVGIIFSISL